MHDIPRSTRISAALGGSALTFLAVFLPAPALASQGGGGDYSGGPPPGVDVGRLLNDIDTPLGPAQPAPAAPAEAPVLPQVDESSFQLTQVALGALAGAAAVGGALVLGRRVSRLRLNPSGGTPTTG